MVVGICDDDKIWCQKAEEVINEYAKSIQENIYFKIFHSKDDLIKYEGGPLDVIFMDIQFDGEDETSQRENGIEIASWINGRWKSCQVVYLSNYVFYATDIFQTDHVYFVLKEQFEKRIPEIFEKLFYRLRRKNEKIIFSTVGGNFLSVLPEDIMYFERNRRITRIATVWGSYEVWDKITEIYEKVSHVDFIRCHNSYLVNLRAIREVKKDTLVMDDDMEISVSRTYRKAFKQAFSNWALKQI